MLDLNTLESRRVVNTANKTQIGEHRTVRIIKSYSAEIKYIQELYGKIPDENEILFIYAHYTFSAFSVILYLLEKYQVINELSISTFNIGKEVITTLIRLFNEGKIQAINIIINDKFQNTSVDVAKVEMLTTKAKQHDNFRVCFEYNHSKVNCVQCGNAFFVLEGSGNSSQKSGLEQYVLLQNREIYEFRKKLLINILDRNTERTS